MAITKKRLFRTIFCIILTLSIMASHMLAFPFVARANAAAVMTGGDLFTMILGVLGWAADSPTGQEDLYGDSFGHMQAKIIKAEAYGDEMECDALYRQACELGFYELVPASAIESYKQHILDTTEHPDWLRWIETQTSEGTLVQTCVDALHTLSRDTMEFIDEWIDSLDVIYDAGKAAVNIVTGNVDTLTALSSQYYFYDRWAVIDETLKDSSYVKLAGLVGDKFICRYAIDTEIGEATRIDLIDLPEDALAVKYDGSNLLCQLADGTFANITDSKFVWYYCRSDESSYSKNSSGASSKRNWISSFLTSSGFSKINSSELVGSLAMAIVGLSVVGPDGNPASFQYDLSNIDNQVKEKVPVTNIGTRPIDESLDDWTNSDEEEKEVPLPSPLDWNKVQNPADMKDLFDTTKDQIQDTEFDDAIDTDIEDTYPDEDDEEKKTKPTGFFFTQIFKAIYFLIMIIIALIMLFVKVFNFAFAVLSIQASPVFVNEGMLMGLNWLKTTKIVGFGISIWDFLVTLVVITLVFFIIRKIRLNIDSIKL